MIRTTYVPPNVLSPFKQRFGGLLKHNWFRELVLIWPTLTRKRFSNKTEDYGVFRPSLVSHINQLSIYVSDIARSRAWYERVAGLTHCRTCEREAHPVKPGWSIRCCYMSTNEHDECLVLVEQLDPAGKIVVPSGMSFFHFAFEVDGNRLEDVLAFAEQQRDNHLHINYGPVRHNSVPPLGDGETGGNVACYLYDPDWNNVEFCGAMDTIENYKQRIDALKGSDKS